MTQQAESSEQSDKDRDVKPLVICVGLMGATK